MKLPNLDSAQAHYRMPDHYAVPQAGHPMHGGVEMNGIFDFISDIGSTIVGGLGSVGNMLGGVLSKVPCVLANAGPTAVSCLTKCGPNPGCLAACAGPDVVQSIMKCL